MVDTTRLDPLRSIADHRPACATRGTHKGLLMNLLKSAAEFYSLVDKNSLSCFSSAKRRCYLKALCELLLKPSAQAIKTDFESFQNCIMNLFTDIETFSVTACDDTNKSLKHEVQLLIDECLCLVISSNSATTNQEATQIYFKIFESWLSSSKDSPILLHFINRLSKNYNLLTNTYSSEKYCNLLELCMDVYFETNRCLIFDNESFQSDSDSYSSLRSNQSADVNELTPEMLEQKFLTLIRLKENNQEPSACWKLIMNEIDYKLNGSQNFVDCPQGAAQGEEELVDLFEYRCLKHSSYLLLYSYIHQRCAVFRAMYQSEKSVEYADVLLKYTAQLLKILSTSSHQRSGVFIKQLGGLIQSKPKPPKEEKFILILNKLIEIYLAIMYNCNSSLIQSRVGEQLIQLSVLLSHYGEDSLTNQNPINDGQSMGSDLLASIGLNILAKKSPYKLEFRFFARCMAICLLKQIIIVNSTTTTTKTSASSTKFNALFPKIPENDDDNANAEVIEEEKWMYKVRMSHVDGGEDLTVLNTHKQQTMPLPINKSTSTSESCILSSSMPAVSGMQAAANLAANKSSNEKSMIHDHFNTQFKQAAYQFHQIYQTKSFCANSNLVELANYVNHQLQHAPTSQHFCLPQVYNLSKFLCSQLFKDKYYLF